MLNMFTLMRSLVLFSLCCVFSSNLFAAPKMKLTLNGMPNAVIVLATDALSEETLAAKELQKYIQEMSGARLQVRYGNDRPEGTQPVIFIGDNPYLKKKKISVDSDIMDAYIIKTLSDNTVVLLGNSARGTIYSVYHFLKKLGCRWYMPGEFGEVVPSVRTIRVSKGLMFLEIPDFDLRHYKADGDLPQLTRQENMDVYFWMLKNRINRGFSGSLASFNAFIGTYGHTYKKIIPQEEFQTHPEYFSLIDGQREDSGQRCTSNKSLISKTKQYVDRYFDTNEKSQIVSISPNDNSRWCQCDACLPLDGSPNTIKGTSKSLRIYSGRVHRFASEIADYMEKKHPGKYAYVYAYGHYTPFPPPLKANGQPFKVNDNLIINVCYNLNACDNRSITAKTSTATWFRRNVINPWTLNASNVWFHHYTYRWSALEIPWPMWHIAASDMRYLHDKGLWGFFASGGKLNWGSNGLYYYIVARLMWETDADVNRLIKSYCHRFYENAASDMRKYYHHMARSITTSKKLLKNRAGIIRYIEQTPMIYTEEVMEKGYSYLDRAITKAESLKVKNRIEIVLFAHQYSRKLMTFIKAYTISQKEKTPSNIERAIDAGNRVLDYIRTDFVKWSISRKTSNGYGGEEFVKNMVERLEKQL